MLQRSLIQSCRLISDSASRRVMVRQPQLAYGVRIMTARLHRATPCRASEGWPSGATHPIMQKIQQNPHIMQRLVDFTVLLQKKGINVQGKQPGFTEMMKIMADPEIKEAVKGLAQDMQAAGIQLDMQSIAEIQKSLEQARQEQQEDQNPGIMDKVKGLFKK